jgi:5'-3' exonuclease
MGIPLFRKPLLERFSKNKRIMEKIISKPRKCSALYIDGNSIIHTAIGMITDEFVTPDMYHHISKLTVRLFRLIIQYYSPSNLVYISIDGPAPMTKIQQQKERRYLAGCSATEGEYMSSLVTPGTDFMFFLHDYLKQNLYKKSSSIGIKRLIYSSHTVPGEGEHKILSFIRTNRETVRKYENSHIIYGNDTDLILLGLAIDLENLYVCRETVPLSDENQIQVGNMEDPINIDALREALENVMEGNYIKDFIYACSLLGNDFIPRSPIFSKVDEGLEFILKTIKDMRGILNKKELFFKRLSERETFSIDEEVSLRRLSDLHQMKNKSIRDGKEFVEFQSPILDEINSIDFEGEDLIKLDMFREMWYAKEITKKMRRNLFSIKSHEKTQEAVSSYLKSLLDMCCHYIKGLDWVYNYYMLGQDNVTWLWYYPYSIAPLFRDIYATLKANQDKKIIGFEESILNNQLYEEVKFTCAHQILAVMPFQAKEYIPKELYPFYTWGSPIIHLMPISLFEDFEFCEVPYQSRLIIPKANYKAIISSLSDRLFALRFVKKYSNTVDSDTKDIIFNKLKIDKVQETIVSEKRYKRKIISEGRRGRGAEGERGGRISRGRGDEGERGGRISRGRGAEGERGGRISRGRGAEGERGGRISRGRGAEGERGGRISRGRGAEGERGGRISRGRGAEGERGGRISRGRGAEGERGGRISRGRGAEGERGGRISRGRGAEGERGGRIEKTSTEKGRLIILK